MIDSNELLFGRATGSAEHPTHTRNGMAQPVTKSLVLGRTRASDLASVTKLNLYGAGVSSSGVLKTGELLNLTVLSASMNELDDSALDEIVSGCPALEELFLRGNRLDDVAGLARLSRLSKLKVLWVGDNPLSGRVSASDLRLLLLRCCPGLEAIDSQGESLPAIRAAQAFQDRASQTCRKRSAVARWRVLSPQGWQHG
jgi:hypothetical protein